MPAPKNPLEEHSVFAGISRQREITSESYTTGTKTPQFPRTYVVFFANYFHQSASFTPDLPGLLDFVDFVFTES
jgi:hypothetical protein